MGALSVLGMLALSGAAVLLCGIVVIRFDLSAKAERHRFERRVRRGAARLIREADQVRRTTAH